ncbi:putative tetratricopeptide-like helical domain superfamily [Helianthus annuus]|uniref:Tetratricopeptide-like helical domain superfamily n=1 Tax=Helianthus annuus TaxID=4232 RepID=A0A251STJ0_HELAN|nr:putative tetratricopeptide-like helical domain superfamily [Helianthus annuus]KAJ0476981.1 putative tetratricopeptide-like helical domain superfamily [Helianthus annuus]KAJ0481340.1 putative tetratricopeptide-like helical domain superfamily [Helianthus annuus]KAJ0497809.1 putative tetratricopeptide-like helical domain superfamily [Helianthus annuus]KAJ0663818.1 putative tetratricopeptide-like helical domain superfamily [Helianthus annuus]
MLRSNISPTNLTFPSVLKSTAALQEGWLGMEIHTEILKMGLLCDRVVLLHLVDISQWGDEQALSMFFEMLEHGVKPNDQTIVCVLFACAKARAIETGTRIHDYILSNGFALKKGITALVDMYAKCGSIDNAVMGGPRGVQIIFF